MRRLSRERGGVTTKLTWLTQGSWQSHFSQQSRHAWHVTLDEETRGEYLYLYELKNILAEYASVPRMRNLQRYLLQSGVDSNSNLSEQFVLMMCVLPCLLSALSGFVCSKVKCTSFLPECWYQIKLSYSQLVNELMMESRKEVFGISDIMHWVIVCM